MLAAHICIARLQAKTVYAYRGEVVGRLLVVLMRIFLLNAVWSAAYGSRIDEDGLSLAELLTFVTVANLQLIVLQPMLVWYLQGRIHTGTIASDLGRPIPFLQQLLFQQLGATAALLPLVVVSIPVALIIGGLSLPPSIGFAIGYIASLALAYFISVLIGLLMGLVAFWTVQTLGVSVIYEFATQFFGGALIPLMFLPTPLRLLSDLLPFKAQISIPVTIYMGKMSTEDLGGAVAFQGVWLLGLALFVALVWRRAQRIITIQRG
jgi:viologen exporter family transport system permease protein